MANLFRQAKQLLDKKDAGGELTEEELGLINTATIPLMLKTDGIFPKDITIAEGLEELANMVDGEESKGNKKSRGRAVVSSGGSVYWPPGVGSSPTPATNDRKTEIWQGGDQDGTN